jgi:hypothetical protein
MSSGELALAWASFWHVARASSHCGDGPVAQPASVTVITSKPIRKVAPIVPSIESSIAQRLAPFRDSGQATMDPLGAAYLGVNWNVMPVSTSTGRPFNA